ncbi:adenosine 5'-monophosphoramidase HINT3-like [Wyeomyia smithii]|uniref:adenosine 5'-monophosphoramidase HINT3-like n=1 Tax=Wyeomyia smithii TaxID=174621 RepID=UPI002467C40A|nr:adenosine 5'-monophosphoramidase HINT3-like [Wyeomyia smithii]
MASTRILERCIFCQIATGKDPTTKILFQNERVCIFKDIRPAAEVHLLAIPGHHLDDVRSLSSSDRPLLEELKAELSNVLRDQFQTDPATALFGFHIPPFTTVKHLHMHAIAPTSSMGFISRMIFKPGSWWFNTEHDVLEKYTPLLDAQAEAQS